MSVGISSSNNRALFVIAKDSNLTGRILLELPVWQ